MFKQYTPSTLFINLIAIIIFVIYLGYAIGYIFLIPYPPLTIDSNWTVINNCVVPLCPESTQAIVEVGDVVTRIGNVLNSTNDSADTIALFSQFEAGELISLEFERDDEIHSATFIMPKRGFMAITIRLLTMLTAFPFWLAGTGILLFVQPHDQRWRLLTSFFYLVLLWFVMGILSVWGLWSSAEIVNLVSWLLAALLLHIHWQLPHASSDNRYAYPLYAGAGILAILESANALPDRLFLYGLAGSIVLSVIILAYRWQRATPVERIPIQLILAGLIIPFGPGVAAIVLNSSQDNPIFTGAVPILACATLPTFYVYALFRRRLGRAELRINRVLSYFAYLSLFGTLFVLWMLFGLAVFDTVEGALVFNTMSLLLAAITIPWSYSRFQRWFNLIAYGAQHNVDEVIALFANRIPAILDRNALIALLVNEIMPTMLIRESAIYRLQDEQLSLIYKQSLDRELTVSTEGLLQTKTKSGRYLTNGALKDPSLSWVRLAIPLQTGERAAGMWLFGRRDPDDFYPQRDITLLSTLANQVATTLDNIDLYDQLAQYAVELESEVAKRTAELETEKQRTEAILEGAGEGVFFCDQKGQILYANPALSNLLGYRPQEITQHNLQQWYRSAASQSAKYASTMYREVQAAMLRQLAWTGQLICIRKDQSVFDAALTLTPITAEASNEVGFVGILTDITDIRELDRLKDRFISNITHELRTPLTTIRTFVQLMTMVKAGKRAHYRDMVNHEIDRLVRLVEDLLNLSRLEAEVNQLNLEPTNLSHLVRDVVMRFRTQAAQKSIQILVSEASEHQLPKVPVDTEQITMLLTNLINNALSYCPEHTAIQFNLSPITIERTDFVKIEIADNGPGIAHDDVERLFERFYRGRTGQKSGVPGSGLGLAICREIVLMHHGTIEVSSEVGVGTTFSVHLPINLL